MTALGETILYFRPRWEFTSPNKVHASALVDSVFGRKLLLQTMKCAAALLAAAAAVNAFHAPAILPPPSKASVSCLLRLDKLQIFMRDFSDDESVIVHTEKDATQEFTDKGESVAIVNNDVMQESLDKDKSVVIGAAAVDGIVGIYLFHDLWVGLVLAAALAYSATLTNAFGITLTRP